MNFFKKSVEKRRLKLTRIGHPVFDGLGDVHRNPGALGLRLNGAGIDVSLSGRALLIGPQQLHKTNMHFLRADGKEPDGSRKHGNIITSNFMDF